LELFKIKFFEGDSMADICVLGSVNMDLIIKVDDMPAVGETIKAKEIKKICGGKGANQAVAVARLGGSVAFIGCIGKDENGEILLETLKKEKIDTKTIRLDDKLPTGVAYIIVDKKGRNMILVYSGMNSDLNENDVYNNKEVIANSKILISQLEIPLNPVIKAFKIAKEKNVITILNPSPVCDIPDELYRFCDIIIPNEMEAERLTGIYPATLSDIEKIGEFFYNKGIKISIITLGERGSAIYYNGKINMVSSIQVNVIDTTAAGDTFIGAFAWQLSKIDELTFEKLCKIVELANKVAAISVTKEGAQTSIPHLSEVIDIYGSVE
jgi:ribokinase